MIMDEDLRIPHFTDLQSAITNEFLNGAAAEADRALDQAEQAIAAQVKLPHTNEVGEDVQARANNSMHNIKELWVAHATELVRHIRDPKEEDRIRMRLSALRKKLR